MDAVRNERRDSPALSSDSALPPPTNVADRQKTLVVNEPWADVSQYLPETKTSYAAAFFARTPALRSTATGSAPLAQTAHMAPSPLASTADALRGVRLAATEPSLPGSVRADTSRARYAGNYRLYPQVQVDAAGTERIAYWTAYNTKDKRTDFFVGPEQLGAFQSNARAFADIAVRVPDPGLQSWEAASGRAIDSILSGEPARGAQQLGQAWRAALTDSRFVTSVIENTVLSLAGATALDEVRAAQELDGSAATSRLYRGNAEVSGEGIRMHEYRPNLDQATRSVDEARTLARAQGVDMPDWMVVRSDPLVPVESNFAQYQLGGKKPPALLSPVTWDELAPEGVVVVRVHPSVFASDEAIVGVLSHEAHELTSLQQMLEQNGPMTYQQVQAKIHPSGDRNLHGQAWSIADNHVLAMRAQTVTARASVEARLDSLRASFAERNGIQR